ncbi:MAG: cupin domain-containing protein [Ignavibacteria bacterium]
MKNNLFEIPDELDNKFEFFQTLYSDEKIEIEKIISTGQVTPEGKWLTQEKNEWVILITGNAEIVFYDERNFILNAGDHLFIPSGVKHRVEKTSSEPKCIWLAVHF